MPSRKTIDLTGLRCPMPIVELNRLIKELDIGDEFLATADDPAFCLDAEAWCRATGNELVEICDSDARYSALIRKCG